MTERPTADYFAKVGNVLACQCELCAAARKLSLPVHGSTPSETVEPAPGASTDGAGSLSEWLA